LRYKKRTSHLRLVQDNRSLRFRYLLQLFGSELLALRAFPGALTLRLRSWSLHGRRVRKPSLKTFLDRLREVASSVLGAAALRAGGGTLTVCLSLRGGCSTRYRAWAVGLSSRESLPLEAPIPSGRAGGSNSSLGEQFVPGLQLFSTQFYFDRN
jgi:hypothetical protein